VALNILFVNDSSSNPNWGDRAAAMALRKIIEESGARIQYTITEDNLRDSIFFPEDSSGDGADSDSRSWKDRLRPLVPPIALELRERTIIALGLTENDSGGFAPATADDLEPRSLALRDDEGQFSKLRSAMLACDVVVIHGDGGMFGNGVIPRTKLFLAYAARKMFDKPVMLINHTADLSHPNLDQMAAVVYPMLSDVTYRERISEARCEGRWPGRYSPDSAFLFKPLDREVFRTVASRPHYYSIWPDSADFDPARPFICVGGSSALSYDENRPPFEYTRQFASLIAHLRTVYDGQILLTVSDRIDEPVMRAVATRLDLPLVGLTIPVQQAVDILGNADAYVGGRWHAGIFGLRGGTPIVPLASKTFKMPALIEMAGLANTVFDLAELDERKVDIGRCLVEVLNQGDDLRHHLRDWAASQAENCRDNISFLDRNSR